MLLKSLATGLTIIGPVQIRYSVTMLLSHEKTDDVSDYYVNVSYKTLNYLSYALLKQQGGNYVVKS